MKTTDFKTKGEVIEYGSLEVTMYRDVTIKEATAIMESFEDMYNTDPESVPEIFSVGREEGLSTVCVITGDNEEEIEQFKAQIGIHMLFAGRPML